MASDCCGNLSIWSTNDDDTSRKSQEEFADNAEVTSNTHYTRMKNNSSPPQDRDHQFGLQSLVNTYGLRKRRSVGKVLDDEDTLLQRVGASTSKKDLEMNRALNKFLTTSITSEPIDEENAEVNAADQKAIEEKLSELIEKEFPLKDQRPSNSQLIPQLGELKRNKALFAPGDWVEIEGLDMKWRMDMITRVVKTAPDDFDWNDPANANVEPNWIFTYNAGADRNVEGNDLRMTESGLKLIFGTRPWVWQQFALLKLEAKLRFQEGHQDDFMEMDIQKFASDSWEWWLNRPENADFKAVYDDERVGEKGRRLLLSHIQKPFNLIDIMGEENKEWNFAEDDNINIFTYLSMYGTGVSLPLLVLIVQLVIPVVLVMEAFGKEGDRCSNNGEWTTEIILAKIMSLVVFIYYTFSVIPDTYSNFFNVAGAADSVYSRLLSLRRTLWLQADDNLLQMIGYKFDIYFNTSYETLLSMLNIYVILLTEEAIEIILNALAFAFIARIDEDLTKTDWYDPKRRWCTAGAQSMALQTFLQLNYFKSAKLFGKKYNIPEKKLLEACNGDRRFLNNAKLAKEDMQNPQYMTHTQRLEAVCTKIAKAGGNRNALEEYSKPKRYFGVLERYIGRFFGSKPIFERFSMYRVWSRWDKILFLSPVPDINIVFENDTEGNVSVSRELDNISLFEKVKLENFYPHEDDKNARILFMRHFRDVLLFKELGRSMKNNTGVLRSLFRIFDGVVISWLSYFIHIVFPLYLGLALGEIIYSLVEVKCVNIIAETRSEISDWIFNLFGY